MIVGWENEKILKIDNKQSNDVRIRNMVSLYYWFAHFGILYARPYQFGTQYGTIEILPFHHFVRIFIIVMLIHKYNTLRYY